MNRQPVQTHRPTRVVLLGPQRFNPTLASALEALGSAGPLAVVTAGWQEREEETDELSDHVGRELIQLALYRRFEDVLLADAELAAALRHRQEQLQELQQLYRLRLAHALEAARELMARPDRGEALLQHRRAAIRALRTLDRQHVVQLRKVDAEFDRVWKPSARPAVAAHRDELAEALDRSAALAVAGGHVAVLRNRLRLFDLFALAGTRPVVAWSAGAMALSDRVVLFRDSPPQGAGNAEVLDSGLSACPNIVPLPHARRRLRLNDPVRVSLFARRLAGRLLLLERESRIEWDGETLRFFARTLYLNRRGRTGRLSRR